MLIIFSALTKSCIKDYLLSAWHSTKKEIFFLSFLNDMRTFFLGGGDVLGDLGPG